MKPPFEQSKEHIIKCLEQLAKPCHEHMVVPCYFRDYEDFKKASELPDVKERLRRRGMSIEIKVIDKPDILIATVDDVMKGKADHILYD